jgi:hypothetical protein
LIRAVAVSGLLLLAVPAPALHAAEVPSAPALRIESAMHTATISRIAVDSGEHVIVTGSWDKTVRLWEPRSGRLLRTIDLPAGKGNEGQVYALAITPDGKTIAAGGWTGWDWNGTASVYLFDRGNGHLIRRISGLPGRAIRMAYSPDGRRLAVCLRGSNGVRLFDPSGNPAGEDRDYEGDCAAASFGADGKLVTSSRDGFLRLYAPPENGSPLRLIAKRKSESGQHPFGVAFSPDGFRIAVGFDDSPAVTVLSGADLTPLFNPGTASVSNGNLASVAWSASGAELYAGGVSANGQASRIIRIWSDRGKGPWRDVPVSRDTIMDIVSLPSGGFVFAAGDPAWGRITSSGERRFVVRPNIADYRGERDQLLVSPDGMTVQFSFRLGAPATRFSVTERALQLKAASDVSLHPPRTSAAGLLIEHWENSSEPVLNGRPLALERDEIARSVAVTHDGAFVLVGTEWNLDLFGRDGTRQWSVAAPDVAWAANVSGDSSVAVAAFADGTIHWYRMRDGEELFALLPNPDGKWVVWTASGYYDCSPGAERLVGWHLNRGQDQAADFFPVSRFRATLYRPDIIAGRAKPEMVSDLRPVDVVRLLPPVVEITYPEDHQKVSSHEQAVFFAIRTPSGEPVTAIRAFVNGRPVPAARTSRQPVDSESVELTIPMPAEDAEVSVIAENRLAASDPAILHLQWTGPKPSEVVKPVLYLLAIGLSHYRDKQLKLEFPSKDAGDVVRAFEVQQSLYSKVEKKILVDEKATSAAVRGAFDWIVSQPVKSNDSVIVFIAGHGANWNQQYYFLPYDADWKNLASTAISARVIEETIGKAGARAVLLLDTCHSGKVFSHPLAGDLNGAINELSAPEHGIVVLAASTGEQKSFENSSWGNGAFTKAVVEGLSGRGSSRAEVTVTALISYVSERVVQLTGGLQSPAFAIPSTIPNFPISLHAN